MAQTVLAVAEKAVQNAPMTSQVSLERISLNDRVRFKDERLGVLTPADRGRLEGRIGVVQGYWNTNRKLTVHFPQDGDRFELRIMSVDVRHLERLDGPPAPSTPPPQEPVGAGEKLSQSDTDDLFG